MADKQADPLLEALAHFEANQAKVAKMKTFNGPDVCATYKIARPVIMLILPFLSMIPVVGARVVNVIKTLTGVLDLVCPAG